MVFHGLNLTFGDSLLRFFPEFLAGIATAKFLPDFADDYPNIGIAITGLAILLGASLTESDALMVLGVWMVLWGLAMQGDAEKPATIGGIAPLHWLGVLSYAIYMSFSPVELLVAQGFRRFALRPDLHPLLYGGVMIVLTVGLGAILHYSIELPARQMINQWLDPKKAEALATGTVPL
jgi:peptidoglycan/LPS O-acetylase OafA/YrhL